MNDPWEGDERREAERRQPKIPTVIEMVDYAARNAAQDVAQIHRRRLVRQTFVAALIGALIVVVPIVLYTNDLRVKDSRANATYNCRTLKTLSDVFHTFITSDANLRYQQQHYAQKAQVISAFSKIITPKLLRQLQDRSDRLDTRTQATWTNQLAPKLESLANANCQARIR